ncbi:hypothetical protein JCM3770_005276 [Rhodotorula araucariae]
MDPGEPTHFNVLIAGTGLHESILAAALSKAGYSVLQLDSAPYYGTEHASLSLLELAEWARSTPGAEASSPAPPDALKRISQRFALSLFPVLLRAKGPALDLLVRSKVASYLQFGLLGGIALWQAIAAGGKGKAVRVPASKADVFNDPSLSLVEKRRLTKLLLFAAGDDAFESDKVLAAASDPEIGFVDYLKEGFSLTGTAASSLAYALALCASPSDPALPALQRLRAMIQAMGRYGPSPYLVGHYGGAGDLVGGFSRICAVWGGGQILGRPLLPLDLSPKVGLPVPPPQPPFAVPENRPPAPASSGTTTRPLGIPVVLEEGAEPTTLTGDWVVCSPHLAPTLLPSRAAAGPSAAGAGGGCDRDAHLIALLDQPVAFPPRATAAAAEGEPAEGDDEPDSKLLVFPPGAMGDARVGTCTALMLGQGTMSCPEGYYILYLAAPLLHGPDDAAGAEPPSARALLEPYLDALLPTPLTADTPLSPLYSVSYWSPSPSPSSTAAVAPISANPTWRAPLPLTLPPNLILTAGPAAACPAAVVDTLDLVAPAAERTFWRIVGDDGRAEGVQFFPREGAGQGDNDDDEGDRDE